MSYLDDLRNAKTKLSSPVAGAYLVMLARNPDVKTREEIKGLLDSQQGRYSDATLDSLVTLVQLANKGKRSEVAESKSAPGPVEPDHIAETAPAVSRDVEETKKPSAEDENLGPNENTSDYLKTEEEAEGAEEAKEEDDVDIENAPQAATINIDAENEVLLEDHLEEEPLEEGEVSEPEPPTPSVFVEVSEFEYDKIDVIGEQPQLAPLRVQLLGGGRIQVSWQPQAGSEIYALAADSLEFPIVPSRAAKCYFTREPSITIEGSVSLFSLFSFAGPNEEGQLIGKGRLLAEVSRFTIQEFRDQISINWEILETDTRVCLYRSEANRGLPAIPSKSNLIWQGRGGGQHSDLNVLPGDEYEYLITTEWDSPTGIQMSTGQRMTARVDAPIPDVFDFQARHLEGNSQVEVSFRSPQEPAKVRLFQFKGTPQSDLQSALIDTEERDVSLLAQDGVLTWLGTEIKAEHRQHEGTTKVVAPVLAGGRESQTYIAVSVLGNRFRVMQHHVVQQIGEIDSMDLVNRFDYQVLRVAPPAGAEFLEVWIAGEGVEFHQISSMSADRQVQISDEYRRFGGIIFADDVAGVSGATRLDAEPKRIFVRGASNFKGVRFAGPEKCFEYPGHLAVSFRKSVQSTAKLPNEQVATGLFGRKKLIQPAQTLIASTPLLELMVEAPSRLSSRMQIRHIEAPTFPIDGATENAVVQPSITLQPNEYREWATFRDENGQPRPMNNGLLHNLEIIYHDSSEETVAGFPAYTADGGMDSLSAWRNPRPDIDDLKVVIVGPKQSGKSTYVQSFLNYLEHQFSRLYSLKLFADPQDPWAQQAFQNANKFVLTRELPQATRTAATFIGNSDKFDPNVPNPLRAMKFLLDAADGAPLKSISITDVAGEDMDSVETMSYYSSSLGEADLVIFLLDVLQLPAARAAMAGLPLPPQGTDPHMVLRNLLEASSKLEIKPTQKVAVVLSKFDGFESMSRIPGSPISQLIHKGMYVTRDPNSHTSRLYNELDGVMVEAELRALLSRLHLGAFLGVLDNNVTPAHRRLFASSALGHSRHGTKVDDAGITPMRISDPIRWALAAGIDSKAR